MFPEAKHDGIRHLKQLVLFASDNVRERKLLPITSAI